MRPITLSGVKGRIYCAFNTQLYPYCLCITFYSPMSWVNEVGVGQLLAANCICWVLIRFSPQLWLLQQWEWLTPVSAFVLFVYWPILLSFTVSLAFTTLGLQCAYEFTSQKLTRCFSLCTDHREGIKTRLGLIFLSSNCVFKSKNHRLLLTCWKSLYIPFTSLSLDHNSALLRSLKCSF